VADQWRKFGGLETLTSYGVPVGSMMLGRNYEQAAQALKAAVPQEHLEFISNLRTSASVGGYFLCMRGSVRGFRWKRKAPRISYGSADLSSKVEPISARSSCMDTLRRKSPKCSPIAST